MTLILSGTDNSVSSPAVQGGTAGTTTGVYYPATNQLALATNGTQAVLVDSSQNVGIGTASPSVKLDVSGSVRFGATSSNRILYLGQSSPADNGAGSLEFQVSNTVKNWAVRTNYNVAGALEFCPSTAAGGTTYTTPSMVIDSSGRVLVGLTSPNTSGANFQVSSGVTFPATQSASSDANTLDDYEEGTWTPTITGGTTNPTITYSTQSGFYTKVGRQVTITGRVSATAASGGSGQVLVSGLPFANGSDTLGFYAMQAVTGSVLISAYLDGSITYLRFYGNAPTNVFSSYTLPISANFDLIYTFSYFTT